MLTGGAAYLLSVIACGDRSPTGSTEKPLTAAVRGSVTSAKTTEGVANLVIALVSGGRVVRASPTDSRGAFEFLDVPAGDYTAHVTGLDLAGVNPRYTALEPLSMDVHVGGGTEPELFFAAVGLVPARIVGVVRCGGAVVAGARLRVIGGTRDEVVESNAQGRYAATDLDPGNYAVIVEQAACPIVPSYRTAKLLRGQGAELNFDG